MPSPRLVPTGPGPATTERTASGRDRLRAVVQLRAMRASRGLAAGALNATCAVGLAACGGGERQDAHEPDGSFRLQVVDASFPVRQSIADRSRLVIRVRN